MWGIDALGSTQRKTLLVALLASSLVLVTTETAFATNESSYKIGYQNAIWQYQTCITDRHSAKKHKREI
jgi:hypothetical protein